MKTNKNTFLENRLIYQFSEATPPTETELPEVTFDGLKAELQTLREDFQNIEQMTQREISEAWIAIQKIQQQVSELRRSVHPDIDIPIGQKAELDQDLQELETYIESLRSNIYESSPYKIGLVDLMNMVEYSTENDGLPTMRWIEKFNELSREGQEIVMREISYYLNHAVESALFDHEFWTAFKDEFNATQHDGRKVNWKKFVKKSS